MSSCRFVAVVLLVVFAVVAAAAEEALVAAVFLIAVVVAQQTEHEQEEGSQNQTQDQAVCQQADYGGGWRLGACAREEAPRILDGRSGGLWRFRDQAVRSRSFAAPFALFRVRVKGFRF